jgi:hypothetical protein
VALGAPELKSSSAAIMGFNQRFPNNQQCFFKDRQQSLSGVKKVTNCILRK